MSEKRNAVLKVNNPNTWRTWPEIAAEDLTLCQSEGVNMGREPSRLVRRGEQSLREQVATLTAERDEARAKILALPRRREPISGQVFSYVKLDDVLAILEAKAAK